MWICEKRSIGTFNFSVSGWVRVVNPIQDKEERGKKTPPTSFSPVTSTNVGISLQNFLTFNFNTFATLV